MEMDAAKAWRRRKGGRPVLPAADKRNHKMILWLNESELSAIRDASASQYLHPAAYVRLATTNTNNVPCIGSGVPVLNRDAWLSMARLLANVNQYQRAVNEGIANAWPEHCIPALLREIHALRLSLVTPPSPTPSPAGTLPLEGVGAVKRSDAAAGVDDG